MSLLDPFGTPDLAVNPNPDPSTVTTLQDQWNGFLADPRGRAALASFGTQLMQPTPTGQTSLGQFGQALGQGGESVRNTEKLDLLQADSDSKASLRTAQADTAAQRAATAETRASLAAERLGRVGDTEASKNERNRLSNLLRAQGQYQNYIKDTQKRNSDVLRTTPPEEIKGFQEWLGGNPTLRDLLGVQGLDTSSAAGGDTPPAPGTPPSAAPASSPGVPPPASREIGKKYQTPRGPMTWTGTGWTP